MKHNKILFVCLANVCRSPMAEWLMKETVRKRPEDFTGQRIDIRSAGIVAIDGNEASDQAMMIMRERKIDMSRHRARKINQEMIDWADLVFCMTQEQVESLRSSFPEMNGKLHLITEYCGAAGDIADPSGKPTPAFEQCARELDSLTGSVLAKIKPAPS